MRESEQATGEGVTAKAKAAPKKKAPPAPAPAPEKAAEAALGGGPLKPAREFTEAALREVLVPLGDCLDPVVRCGSWVPFVYRRWMLGQTEGRPMVRTLDVDLAVPSPLTPPYPIPERAQGGN